MKTLDEVFLDKLRQSSAVTEQEAQFITSMGVKGKCRRAVCLQHLVLCPSARDGVAALCCLFLLPTAMIALNAKLLSDVSIRVSLP